MLKTIPNPLLALRNHMGRGRSLPVMTAKEKAASTRAAAQGQPAGPMGQLNPYVEARREWNERYGDYIHQARHWRTVAIFCAIAAAVSVSGVVYVGAQSKIVPYVVEVDKLGAVAAVDRADRATAVDGRVIKAFLARFVTDWRTVTIDRQAQKAAIDRLYAMLPSGSIALGKLNEHFRAHNPFGLAATESVAVAVTNLLLISDQTWQVEWQETTRDRRGAVQSIVRMKASIIVGVKPPTEESLILINPLGVYVTDLNWSQQL